MEVRLYDTTLSIEDRFREMELIKVVDLEMYKDLDFGGFIIIDGQAYKHCMYNSNENILGVKPVQLNEDGEEVEYSDDFECPYCGSVDHDAWELSQDHGTTECSSCGSEIEYEREYTVSYNIKPIKCAPVTRID